MTPELLAAATQRELPVLDEKLHLDVFCASAKACATSHGRRVMILKRKNRTLFACCVPAPAVHMLAFLEVFTENLMAQYGREIHRHDAKRAKRNINT